MKKINFNLYYLLPSFIVFLLCFGNASGQILQCQQPCAELINNNLIASVPSSFTGTTASFTLNVSSVFVASTSSSTYLQSNFSPGACTSGTGALPGIRVQIAKQTNFSVWYGFFTNATQCASDVNAILGNMEYNSAQSRTGNVTSFNINLSGLTSGTYKVIARMGSSVTHSQYSELGTFTVTTTTPSTCSPAVSLLSPNDGVIVTSGTPITLNWSGNAGGGSCTISGYEVELTAGGSSGSVPTTNTSNSLNVAGSFSWRVRAKTGTSNWGSWSSSRDVIMGSAPPTGCTISSLSPSSANIVSTGGGGNSNVSATSGQSWSATANNSWIFTNSSGVGSGSLSYSVDPNSGSSRSGTITITCGASSQTFTISQAGTGPPPSCTLTLSSTSGSIASTNGSSESFTVSSAGTWTVSDNVTWLTTTKSGSTVNISATSANTSASPRSATITVDCGSGITETYTLTQDGTAPPANSLTVSTTNVNFTSASAGTQTITINSTNVNWTAIESSTWFTISPANGGNGTTTLTINATANTGASRNSTITINGGSFNLIVNVSQVANPGPVCFTIGSIRICADASSTISPGVESLSGNIKVFLSGSSTNAVMTSTGTITINTNNSTISGSGGLSISNITGYGSVQLIQGNFNFSVSQAQLNKNNPILNNLFALIGLPVEIDKIEVIMNGILLTGKISLPSVWKGAKAQITQISITTNGIGVAGVTCLPKMSYGGFGLEMACLNFNTTQTPSRFQGSIKAKVGFLGGALGGVAEIFSGSYGGITLTEINKLSLSYIPTNPVLIGTTGFGVSKLTGIANNLSVIASNKNPMYASLLMDITTLDPLKAVQANNLDFTYTFGESFEISTEKLKVFGTTVASANMKFTPTYTNFRASANFLGMVRGKLGANLNYGSGLSFRAGIMGDFYTPTQQYVSQVAVSNVWLKPIWNAAVALLPNNSYKLGSTFGLLTANGNEAKIEGGATVSVNLGSLLGKWNSQVGYKTVWLGGTNFQTSLFTEYNTVAALQSQVSGLLAFKKYYFDEYSTYASNDKMALPMVSYQYFEVEGNNREIIVGAQGSSSPIFNIEFPNGTIVTANNFQNYDNINYMELSATNDSYYFLRNIPAGTYKVHNLNNSIINVAKAGKAPKIQINNVTQTGNTINMTWLDSYTDGNGKISLGYDTDKEGYNGTIFAENISELDPTNQYTWSAGNIPTGNYYIYAIVRSDDGQFSFHYGDRLCKIITDSAPSAPLNLTVNVIPTDTLNLNWTASATPKVTYRIYHTAKGNVNYESPSFAIDSETNAKLFEALLPGKVYQFAITAVDSLGRQSDMSNVISYNYVSTTANNAPRFNSFNFPTIAKIGQNLTYQVNATDIDANPITYSFINAPLGMTISNTGLISWMPDNNSETSNSVYIKIADPSGASDSTSFFIRTYDNISGKATASFNKSLYQNYTDKAFIEITDNNLNFSPNTRDSVQVKIYSNSDNIGINIWLREVSDDALRFQSNLSFNNNASNATNKTLFVQAGDSIFVKYTDPDPSTIVKSYAYFQNFFADFKLGTNAVCFGDKMQTLNKSWGDELSYSWKINGQEISTQRHPELIFPNTIVGGNQILSLTVNDKQGRTATKTQSIKISRILNNYTKKDITCKGANDGKIQINVSGNIGTFNVQWRNLTNPLQTSISLNSLSPADYLSIITDSLGCQRKDTIRIYEPLQLDATADTTGVSCFNSADGKINLKPIQGTQPYNYKWYRLNDSLTVISNNEDLENLSVGGYRVRVTDANGCWIWRSYLVSEPQPLQVTLKVKNVSCIDAQDGGIETIITGGRPPYLITHIGGQTTLNVSGLSATTNIPHTVLVKDSKGCAKTATANILLSPKPLATISTTPVCFGESSVIKFTYNGQIFPYSIKYGYDSQVFVINGIMTPTHQVIINSPVNDRIYRLQEVTFSGVCKSDLQGEAKIVVWSLPIVNTISTKPENCGNKNAVITITPPTAGQSPYLYALDNGTYQSLPIFDSLSKGTYTLHIKDFNACAYVYAQTITINEINCPLKDIPNLITPNGDGKNDFWEPEVLQYYKNCIVKIRDAKGRIVFTSDIGYYPRVWGAEGEPMGTYYYEIDLRDGSNPYTGFISVVR